MNSLSNAEKQLHCYSSIPIPPLLIYILIPLFFITLAFSIFILAVVHNVVFLLSLISLSSLIATFLLWNCRRNSSLHLYLRSFPDSDLRFAHDGDIVKITGVASCGNVGLEASYEKVQRCVYTSTMLYDRGELGLKPADVKKSCFQWRLTYSERFCTDFNITDAKSGNRVMVKAGSDCKVIPLIVETVLVKTRRKCKILSTHLKKWLTDRNLPVEARLLRLEEGCIREGSCVSVIGMLSKNGGVVMIVEPPVISTGCFWRKLLLPVDVDGLIIGVPEIEDSLTLTHPNSVEH